MSTRDLGSKRNTKYRMLAKASLHLFALVMLLGRCGGATHTMRCASVRYLLAEKASKDHTSQENAT